MYQASPHNDFYVYALFRENGQPFYIGKGRRSRWRHHEYRAVRGGSHKDNIIWSMRSRGVTVPKCKLVEHLTQEEAWDIEKTLIFLIGRIPHGPLVNWTAGGDGASGHTPEARARIRATHRGRKLTEEHKAKISAAGLGRVTRLETKAKQRAAHLGRKKSIEHCLNMSIAHKGIPNPCGWNHTEEAKAKIRAVATGRACSVKTRAKMSASRSGQIPWNKGLPMSPNAIAKTALANRGRKLSLEHRAAITAANNRRWEKYRSEKGQLDV